MDGYIVTTEEFTIISVFYIKSDSVANEEEYINAYQIVQDTQVHR